MTDTLVKAELVTDDNPQHLMRRATDVAGVSKEIVMKTALTIQGRKYVRVEGWQAIAVAHGCAASSKDVERVEGGYRAIGEIRRMADGMVIATAEGFVGDDEAKTWAMRPEYAKRAMAQTRAISRACRSAFAHVVVLIDSNLSTTPAEEVPDGGFDNAHDIPPQTQTPQPKAAPEPPPAGAAAPKPASARVDTVKLGNFTSVECCLLEYKEVNSKPGVAKPWTAWFCQFADDTKEFEAGTFDRKIGEKLDTLKGQKVTLTHKPGKRENTLEIVSLEPTDELPM